jgi:hypothetical protein
MTFVVSSHYESPVDSLGCTVRGKQVRKFDIKKPFHFMRFVVEVKKVSSSYNIHLMTTV